MKSRVSVRLDSTTRRRIAAVARTRGKFFAEVMREAIEAGLPVLAREHSFMRGRLASAIMRRMDLPELVASTDDDFIEKAVELAANPSKCGELRTKIASRRMILFNDVEPIRALERCLTEAISNTAA